MPVWALLIDNLIGTHNHNKWLPYRAAYKRKRRNYETNTNMG